MCIVYNVHVHERANFQFLQVLYCAAQYNNTVHRCKVDKHAQYKHVHVGMYIGMVFIYMYTLQCFLRKNFQGGKPLFREIEGV